jgi:hypothetical protein
MPRRRALRRFCGPPDETERFDDKANLGEAYGSADLIRLANEPARLGYRIADLNGRDEEVLVSHA